MAMNPQFQTAIERLIADAPGQVSITSGFRDPEKQQQLWADALDKYGDPEVADDWVARPGGSRHEWGAAADLSFASDEVRQWVHQNAPKYGLHFPLDNEDWHIELAVDGQRLSSRDQLAQGATGMATTSGTVPTAQQQAAPVDDRSLLIGVMQSMSKWIADSSKTGVDLLDQENDEGDATSEMQGETSDPGLDPQQAEVVAADAAAPRLAPVVEAPDGTLEQQAEKFLAALRQHESNNQNVPNKGGHSSASGYYQYVDSTWGGDGGYRRAMDAPFAVQHQRAKEDAIRAFRAFGNWEDAAMAHFYPAFAGKRNMWHMIPGQERGKPFSGNPTGQEYVSSVMELMGQVGG